MKEVKILRPTDSTLSTFFDFVHAGSTFHPSNRPKKGKTSKSHRRLVSYHGCSDCFLDCFASTLHMLNIIEFSHILMRLRFSSFPELWSVTVDVWCCWKRCKHRFSTPGGKVSRRVASIMVPDDDDEKRGKIREFHFCMNIFTQQLEHEMAW